MLQRVYVIASQFFISMSTGFVYGQMPGVISSLQKREEGIFLDDGQISLIASSLTILSFVGFALAALSDKIGRRWPYIIFSLALSINWIILSQATNMYQFMLSRIFAGISAGALVVLNIFIVSEYTTPNTRALLLNIVLVISPALGTTLGHILGMFLQWRIVALIGGFTSTVGIVLPYFWIESPHWLASKGKFKECKIAFQKLHGKSSKSARELQLLLKLEEKKWEKAKETNCRTIWKKLVAIFKKRYMWELCTLSMFINTYFVASGKFAFSVLGSVIIEDITGTSNVFLFTLLVDGCLLLGPCISCIIIRKTTMRTLLFSSGIVANLILVIFSLCFYFGNGQNYSNWINVGLLAMYFIIVNAGPYPILEAMYSEMFPLELKLYIFSMTGSILTIAFSLSVFLLPFIVHSIGYHGLFLVNGSIMSMCLGYIWIKLPETKGKTLQEIEVYFKTKNFDIEQVLFDEPWRALI